MNADDCLAITRTLYTNGSVSINYNGTPFMPDDEEPRFYFGLFLPEAEHIKALLGYTILLTQKPITLDTIVEVFIEETQEEKEVRYRGQVTFDANRNLVVPVMDRAIAEFVAWDFGIDAGYSGLGKYRHKIEVPGQRNPIELWGIYCCILYNTKPNNKYPYYQTGV